MRKYLHVESYNIFGGLLLLPLITLFGIDLISRIVQRDLMHYSRPVYGFLSHTLLYWSPVLFTWTILFPLFAVLINLIPLVQNLGQKKTTVFSLEYMKRNIVSLIVLSVGIGFLAMIKLHDVVPCTIHGILQLGVGQLPHILSVCSKA